MAFAHGYSKKGRDGDLLYPRPPFSQWRCTLQAVLPCQTRPGTISATGVGCRWKSRQNRPWVRTPVDKLIYIQRHRALEAKKASLPYKVTLWSTIQSGNTNGPTINILHTEVSQKLWELHSNIGDHATAPKQIHNFCILLAAAAAVKSSTSFRRNIYK